jgi:hypothetical protein
MTQSVENTNQGHFRWEKLRENGLKRCNLNHLGGSVTQSDPKELWMVDGLLVVE